jgi:hypothetical protein
MHIIAVCGYKGAGKTTIGNYLARTAGYQSMAFADGLKDTVSLLFGYSREMLAGETVESRNIRETVEPLWSHYLGQPTTPRQTLQKIGCLFRDHVHPDFWCSVLLERAAPIQHNVVITDLRFPNEAEFFRKRFGRNRVLVIRVERPGLALDTHISETAHLGIEVDAVIENTGSEPELCAKVDRVVKGYYRAIVP